MKEVSFWCDKCLDFIDGGRTVQSLKRNAKDYLKMVKGKHFHKRCWEEMTKEEKQEILRNE